MGTGGTILVLGDEISVGTDGGPWGLGEDAVALAQCQTETELKAAIYDLRQDLREAWGSEWTFRVKIGYIEVERHDKPIWQGAPSEWPKDWDNVICEICDDSFNGQAHPECEKEAQRNNWDYTGFKGN